jgi:DnaJ family protein A protein 2
LALQKQVLCSKCEGRGGKAGATKTCNSCHGRGVKIIMRQMGPMIQQMQQTCPDCNGEGEIINPKDRCGACTGKKVNAERKVRFDCLDLLCFCSVDGSGGWEWRCFIKIDRRV